jgi:hypothetical protein
MPGSSSSNLENAVPVEQPPRVEAARGLYFTCFAFMFVTGGLALALGIVQAFGASDLKRCVSDGDEDALDEQIANYVETYGFNFPLAMLASTLLVLSCVCRFTKDSAALTPSEKKLLNTMIMVQTALVVLTWLAYGVLRAGCSTASCLPADNAFEVAGELVKKAFGFAISEIGLGAAAVGNVGWALYDLYATRKSQRSDEHRPLLMPPPQLQEVAGDKYGSTSTTGGFKK